MAIAGSLLPPGAALLFSLDTTKPYGHVWFRVKLGTASLRQGEALKGCGFSAPTQEVSGAAGSARTDTTSAWAHGDWGETACPTPGMLMIVALNSFAAAAFAPASDVSVSKVPEMSSVGILLTTGWCMVSGAAGTFQTSRQSSLKYAQPPTPSRCIEAG